jgi:iron complex transport system ATP-binding protein
VKGTPVADGTPLLDLADVTVTAGDATLLRDVDWRVRDRERWVVIGPNGAGKSTLLQIASTYRFPSRGVASVLGHRLGRVDVRALRPRIGYASAELGRMLDPRLTAHQAVVGARTATLVRLRGQTRSRGATDGDAADDDRRADDLLARLGVGPLAHRRISSLSEGERRRVQIARALMTSPDLLLLDEPAAGLDIGGREHLVTVLEHLAADRHPAAIVFVTHHVEEVPPGFTHALLLADGAVVAAGPLTTTLTAYALSRCIGLPLDLSVAEGRYTARRRHAG